MGNTAMVFGSTGLIGKLLLEELKNCGLYDSIKSYVRNSTGLAVPSVEEVVTDFSGGNSIPGLVSGGDVYICLGTTIKKAGTVSNMEKIDRDLPLRIASEALKQGVKGLAAVSSIGASAGSSNYYLRIKGEMEQGLMSLSFDRLAIVRPSILLGERKERRAGEKMGKVVMTAVSPLLRGKLKKYRAIHGRDVARSMIYLLNHQVEKIVFESDELQSLSAILQDR